DDIGGHTISDNTFERTSYFVVPPEWMALAPADLGPRIEVVLNRIYDERAASTREADPYDPNYMTLVSASYRVLDRSELAERPWLKSFACYEIDPAGQYHAIDKKTLDSRLGAGTGPDEPPRLADS